MYINDNTSKLFTVIIYSITFMYKKTSKLTLLDNCNLFHSYWCFSYNFLHYFTFSKRLLKDIYHVSNW